MEKSELALASMECIPCKGDVPALKGNDLDLIASRLGNGWNVVDEHHLSKTFTFPDYAETVGFVNGVAEVAEQQGHHPNIDFTYGRATVSIWTHKIDGLTESDFVLAAKIDRVVELQHNEN
jgi:4a-hydroxytetrahydrobiopterin dehydratase